MPEKVRKPESPPNVVIVETPEGIFRIAYGRHKVPQNPEDVKGVDAIMLESGMLQYYLNQEEAIKEFPLLYESVQYKNLIKEAAKAKQPIYLTDLDPRMENAILAFLLQTAEGMGAIGLDLWLLYLLGLKVITKSKKITRRDFLKLLAAAYFGTELVESFTYPRKGNIEEGTLTRKINRSLINLNEKIHPETNMVILTLRNLIMAQKLTTIAKELQQKIGKKPEIGIVVGARHIGIEDALKMSKEERMEIIKRILSIPALEKLREGIATIARFDYNQTTEQWELTEFYKDPNLLELETY
jgi:DNA polymerase IIIc chi subunit